MDRSGTAEANGSPDRRQLEALYREHGEELRRFVAAVAPDAETAQDVLHATFTKALDAPPKVDSLKAWLFRVALNEALLLRRRQAVHQRATLKLSFTAARPCERPDEVLVRRETIARVREAIACLPAEQQTVLRLRIYDEKPFAKIADELGLPLGTVLTRMRLALEKLRKRLKAEDENNDREPPGRA